MSYGPGANAPYSNPYTNGEAYANYQIACQSVDYRAQVRDPHWEKIVQYLWGEQDIRVITGPSENDFVYNLLHKDHRLNVSMLARDKPSIKVLPGTDAVYEQAEELTKIIRHVYNANDMTSVNAELVSYGLPIGHSFLKIGWEGSMRMGMGDFMLRAPDPRNIYFMPGTARVKNALVLNEKMPMDKLTALHQYGKTPGDREAIKWLFKKSRPTASESMMGGMGGSVTNVVAEGVHSRLYDDMRKADDRQSVDIWQQWIIDTTTLKDIPELFERLKSNKAFRALRSDQKEMLENKPLYPRGKVVIFAEDHLFSSRVSLFPSFPYSQYVHANLLGVKPGDEYPPGEYDQLMEVQDYFNEQWNRNKDRLDSAGTRTFVNGDIDRDEVQNNPNGIFQIPVGAKVDHVQSPGPSAEMMKAIPDLFSMARELQNRSDISQGQNPSGARSGEQVLELSDLANRIMVTQNQALENCHKGAARHITAMVGAGFYRKGFHYDERINLMGVSPDAFDYEVTAGINLPATESQKMLWFRMLAELKSIDAQALLELVPETIIPNKRALLQRMAQKHQQEQAALEEQMHAEANAKNAAAAQHGAQARATENNVIPMQGAAA